LVFTLQLPPDALDNQASSDNRVSLEIVTTATAADGKLLDQVSKTVAGAMTPQREESIRKNGVSYQATLHVPTGECTLHFVVRNNFTGRTGSIVVPYTVN
jgi:hypothetical protein